MPGSTGDWIKQELGSGWVEQPVSGIGLISYATRLLPDGSSVVVSRFLNARGELLGYRANAWGCNSNIQVTPAEALELLAIALFDRQHHLAAEAEQYNDLGNAVLGLKGSK